jgi:hypothetical protein
MNVAATGTAPLTYQWYVGASGNTRSPAGGATSSSYTTPPPSSSTKYWVRVSNASGTADSNTAFITVASPTARLVPNDFNHDGLSDLGVFRPSLGRWLIAGQPVTNWGLAGDMPVSGDFNGDGKADVAVFRPSTGFWYVRGKFNRSWGLPGDKPGIRIP